MTMKYSLAKKLRRCLALGITMILWVIVIPREGLGPVLARGIEPDVHIAASPHRQLLATDKTDPTEMVNQGKIYYQSGDYSKASTIWQQAVTIYSERQDLLNQAMTLSNLALAHQKLGQWHEANSKISTSLTLLQKQVSSQSKAYWQVNAQALNSLGSIQMAQGLSQQALKTWQEAAKSYKRASNKQGLAQVWLNQALALKTLGYYKLALRILGKAQEEWQSQPISLVKAEGLNQLGETLRLIGYLNESEQVLKQGLETSRSLNAPSALFTSFFNLGNTARALQHPGEALGFYQQAASVAQSPLARFETNANQLSLFLDTYQYSNSTELWPEMVRQAPLLPVSRPSLYAQLNVTQSLFRMQMIDQAADNIIKPTTIEIEAFINGILQNAKTLGDRHAQSYSLGYLGQLAESQRQWGQAQTLSEQALSIANAIETPEIAYRWLWQLGRIYKAQQQPAKAIAAYSEAVSILDNLRSDISAINPDVQFSFRDGIEPVYRQFVDLLTANSSNQTSPTAESPISMGSSRLEQARKAIENLQLAELDNFFQQACLQTEPVNIGDIDPSAAVIYPIILADRLEVIVRLPGKGLKSFSTPITSIQLEDSLLQLEQDLYQDPIERERYSTTSLLAKAQDLYDWLVRPVESDLAANGVKTIAFVLDGFLRNIPMAILHDGEKYLGQSYGIALAPGLQLLDPRLVSKQSRKVLSAGLTVSRPNFPALPQVKEELKGITSRFRGDSLVDQAFTKNALQQHIGSSSYSIVHLATHGQFSSNAADTFILTWDGRVSVNELDEILQTTRQRGRDSLDLLVLSACQTATGDRRATLGLAGIAVQSGASSTLATLWPVDDKATAFLMREFYRHLAEGSVSKSEALRLAQQALRAKPQFQHPFFWAPFTLVGNWG